MRYGRKVTMTKVNDHVVSTVEEIFSNWETVKQVVHQTESVYVRDEKDVLAEFLKLLDKQKTGEIDCIGIQCLRDGKSGAMRIEKTWTVPDINQVHI